jgi:hypothetical protein
MFDFNALLTALAFKDITPHNNRLGPEVSNKQQESNYHLKQKLEKPHSKLVIINKYAQ